METNYTNERNVQIVISLMKAHNIRKVIASPGTTNITLVASLQQDSFFQVYSSVDERSAAYMACGMAAESGEPVALSCTGATASRNYIPGLTEAYYRKLPVLAITSTQHSGRIGQYMPQVIDRTVAQNDVYRLSVQVPTIYSEEDEWACNVAVNRAMIELRRNGGGPVHINLATNYSKDFTVTELPPTRVIKNVSYGGEFPELKPGKIIIYVGAHTRWDEDLTAAVDRFCAAYDGIVLCDEISNYKGKYRIYASLLTSQDGYVASCRECNIMIHIGQVTGALMTPKPRTVWRVNPDGEIRDTFQKLSYVFEMEEVDFFNHYADIADKTEEKRAYYDSWKSECDKIAAKIPDDLPFSNAWIAQRTAPLLPKGCVLHLGIYNSLRNWAFADVDESILGYSNTGGFGIDGGVSSMIGASLAAPNKLFFCVIGDLAFFYDMNSIGNRFVGNNIRLMIINNGRGMEFRNYNHPAARFGEDADAYMAAAGHFGNQSRNLVRHYAQDLGFEYLTADNKETFLENQSRFLTSEITDKPILFEVFTNPQDESDALHIMRNLETSATGVAKKVLKNVLGDEGAKTIKKFLKK
ncbi:MAG: 2-succinyl-5-enolpyruvyl-6-hydroxy-3-cyclohexene-1-carboxylate synthase [Lachnospiraceae bacterium]|nr:2-succinyl-5-enolpyruvyl-6-hydroxy-3-cyclohexene-1-carboxylate synthase [Lachnospiraceae bacterium]